VCLAKNGSILCAVVGFGDILSPVTQFTPSNGVQNFKISILGILRYYILLKFLTHVSSPNYTFYSTFCDMLLVRHSGIKEAECKAGVGKMVTLRNTGVLNNKTGKLIFRNQ
jgi:hypothetical protein